MNGDFCIFCALFVQNRSNVGALVTRSFTTWIKVNKNVDGHASHAYHHDAVQIAIDFVQSIEHPERNIDVCLNTE